MMKKTLKVQNKKCGGCTNSIGIRLLKLSGINEVQVSDRTSEITFTYETLNDLAIAERTLIQMGYPPEGVDNNLVTKAKSFVSCASGKINL